MEVDHRIAQAWGAFHRHSQLLCSGRGSLRKRFQLLHKVVVPTLMYNIGACNLTQRHLQKFRAVENQMMMRVLRIRLHEDEADGEAYLSSSQSALGLYRKKYNLPRWDRIAVTRVFNWAGHVARFQGYAPDRLAFKALTFRDCNYLHKLENLYGGQLHGHKFKVWRWELQFVRTLGRDWKTQAQDPEHWSSIRDTWVEQRLQWTKF